jgi:hypothetical protein
MINNFSEILRPCTLQQELVVCSLVLPKRAASLAPKKIVAATGGFVELRGKS